VTSSTTPPRDGELFSRVYAQRDTRLSDSPRFRIRIGSFFNEALKGETHSRELRQRFESELGVSVGGYYNLHWTAFFKNAEMRDVLDAITIMYGTLTTSYSNVTAAQWRRFVQRAFEEEGLLYTVDSKCGVRRAVDEEYEHNAISVVRGLHDGRLRAVSGALESALKKLEQANQDRKGAVRDVFESAETLFKLTTDSGANLSTSSLEKHLRPIINRLYGKDPATVSAAGRMLGSFQAWTDAAHPFRHGQKTEVPIDLPEDVAVLLVSQGASFIRWLADIDRGTTPSPPKG